jgi:hypothetical protein
MTTLTLFDIPTNGTATSAAAARSIRPVVGTLCSQVLAAIEACGDVGSICDETERILNMSHQTCSARYRQLAQAGLIVETGETRATRSGRQAAVWRAAK